jgi:hypothetical protein
LAHLREERSRAVGQVKPFLTIQLCKYSKKINPQCIIFVGFYQTCSS